MKFLFTLVAAGLCVSALGDVSTAYYEVVGEHSVLSEATLLAARSIRSRRQSSSPDVQENRTVLDTHEYYASAFKQGSSSDYWFDLPMLHAANDSRVVLSSLSGSSRTVLFGNLPFLFPYYGHILSFIGVGTNGFLYTGTTVHDRIGDFQYIAPLQANFEPSNGSESGIYIYSSDERFTVQWDKMINIDHLDAGVFTFQVSLFPSGEIHFVYKEIPVNVMNISDERHPVRVGVSDAFFHALAIYNGYVYGIIQEYHAVDLSLRNVLSESAIVLSPLPNCIMAQSCMECSDVAQSSDFNCGWCQSLNRCSDGVDRFRQEWIQSGCHQDADLSFCTAPSEVPTATVPPVTTTVSTATVPPVTTTVSTATVPPVTTTVSTDTVPPVTTIVSTATEPPVTTTVPKDSVSAVPSTIPVHFQIAAQASEWQQPGSIAGIFIGILVLLTTVILIAVCVGVAIYGYRHPASRVGMYMIEARKGRFGTNRVDTYNVKEEQLTSEE